MTLNWSVLFHFPPHLSGKFMWCRINACIPGARAEVEVGLHGRGPVWWLTEHNCVLRQTWVGTFPLSSFESFAVSSPFKTCLYKIRFRPLLQGRCQDQVEAACTGSGKGLGVRKPEDQGSLPNSVMTTRPRVNYSDSLSLSSSIYKMRLDQIIFLSHLAFFMFYESRQ